MANLDYVEFEKRVEKQGEKFVVHVTGKEVYSAEEFEDMIQQKKKLLQERQQQVLFLKKKIGFAESVKDSEELTKFKELLEQAQALAEKEDNRKNLKILELDYANVEREVLEYDNYFKGKSKHN